MRVCLSDSNQFTERLSTIFDIDFCSAGPESNPFWRGLERMMSTLSAFNRETWGFWRGYFLVGAGFLMEKLGNVLRSPRPVRRNCSYG